MTRRPALTRRRTDRGTTLRAAMAGTGAWWIRRTGGDYQFIRDLGDGAFLSYDWRVITAGIPGPYLNLHQLGFARVGRPMLSVDDTAGTYDVTGWTHATTVNVDTGYAKRTVVGSIESGTLTRFTAAAGAGTFSANDKGRRIAIPGAGTAGADLVVLVSTVAGDGSYITWSSPAGVVVTGVTATLYPMYRWSTTAGNTAQWSTPAGATAVGVRLVRNTSGGLFAVSIDGSATAANWLPTAQDKVDAGEYPSTILVANGGTLAPTARVLDCYSPTTLWDDAVAVADGLTPGVHTLALTVTGYTHTGAINNRCQVSGYAYATAGLTPTSPGAEVLGTFAWQTGVSAHEYAYRWLPNFLADGTTPNPAMGSNPIHYYGRVHGYEDELSVTVVVDGTPTVLVDGQTVAVTDSATITQVSRLYHPDNHPTLSADSTTVYTLDQHGLTTGHEQTWHVPGVLLGGYPVMLPVAAAFDRYTSSGLHARLTVDSGAGGGVGYADAWIAVAWTGQGSYATSVELLEPLAVTTAGTESPGLMPWWIEDRAPVSGTKINKFYVPWTASPGTPTPITPGDTWRFRSRYRFRVFPDGAEPVLGTL